MKKLLIILLLVCFLSPLVALAALYKSSDGKVWTDWNGKRRWIRTLDIFNSYSYKWSDVKDIADLSLSRKPINNLVRIKDKSEVYALSDNGYKRHIQNPEIFNSYNLSWDDVADINETELAGYSVCNLIKEANNEKVYKLDGNTLYPIKDLATFNYYGFNWNALQIINSEDLATYTIGSELAYIAGSLSPSPVWSPTPTPTTTPSPSSTPTPTPTPTPSPSVSPSPSVTPTPSPSATPTPTPIPLVRKNIIISATRMYNGSVYYNMTIYYSENSLNKNTTYTISASDSGYFIAGDDSNTFCSGGEPANSSGSQHKGNPLTCESVNSSYPWVSLQYIPVSKDMVTITATVSDYSKNEQIHGQI